MDIAMRIRDMREIRGSYEHVTSQNARESGPIDDYIRIVLTDDEMIEDVSAKLRCIYPNLMRIAYDNNRTREIRDVTQAAEQEIDAISPLEVFAELFELQNNASPDEEILKIAEDLFSECTEDFRGGERA
jgi:exonuclease SbcD